MAYSPGSYRDRQSRVAQQAQQQDQVHGPLALVSRGGAPTVTTFDYPNPSFIPLRTAQFVALRAANLGEANSLLPELLNRDSVFAGPGQVPSFEQQQALPPPGPRRPIDNLTYIDPSEIWLAGKDLFFRGAGQAPAYDWPNPTLRRAPAASIYDPGLNLTVLISALPLPAGAQSVALPPRAAPRAADYTHTADLIPNLIGQDAMATGAQLSGNAPAGPARAVDYTWTADLIPNLIGQDAMTVGVQLSGPAPPAPRREVDYTHTADLIPNLVGQDAMVTGVQSVALPPRAAPRGQDFCVPAPLALLTTVVQPIPYGAQLTDALPPRAAARARDYSIAASFPLELNGKDQFFTAPGQGPAYDWPNPTLKPRYQQGTGEAFQDLLSTLLAQVAAAPGKQSTDLPPRAAPRALDYTLIASLIPELIGQDAVNPGVQLSGNAPAGPARARDYTFLASFPLELIGRDAMTAGDQFTDGPYPPRGPARARDYTIASGFLLELIGQDAMLAGEQFTDLAPRAAPRARDYSLTVSYALANTTPLRDLSYALGEPASAWRVRAPRAGWQADEPTGTWRIRPPQE